MQITLSIGLDRLKDLPLDMRQAIQQALGLPMQAVAANTVIGQPSWVGPVHPSGIVPMSIPTGTYMEAPQVQQPVVQPAPEPVVTKQPVLQGNTKVFLPDRGHPTQQNAAIDVMTGQPQQIAAPQSAPVVPQFQNTPVNVSPVATTGPVQMNLQPQADLVSARKAAIQLYNDPSRGGNDTLNACLQMAGMRGMAELNDSNASALYGAILAKTGRV
jgi:hypothetical protein